MKDRVRMRLACSARVMGALAICCGLLGSAAEGETQPVMRSLDPPVMLPDGTEFKTWEQPLRFDRTYYVDGRTRTPGHESRHQRRPFATINRAAQILQPGERVVVASGIYREWVRPARGGSDRTG